MEKNQEKKIYLIELKIEVTIKKMKIYLNIQKLLSLIIYIYRYVPCINSVIILKGEFTFFSNFDVWLPPSSTVGICCDFFSLIGSVLEHHFYACKCMCTLYTLRNFLLFAGASLILHSPYIKLVIILLHPN